MNSLDKALMLWLNFDGGGYLDHLMWLFSEKLFWLPVYILAMWFLYKRFGWKYMLIVVAAAVIGIVVSDQICNYFKHNFQMMRPTHDADISDLVHKVLSPKSQLPYYGGLYGTVSAHAATITSVAVIFGRVFRNGWVRAGLVLWVAAVCYSRIYLGVHFPSQILFGVVLGLLTGFLLNRLIARYGDRYKKAPAVQGTGS